MCVENSSRGAVRRAQGCHGVAQHWRGKRSRATWLCVASATFCYLASRSSVSKCSGHCLPMPVKHALNCRLAAWMVPEESRHIIPGRGTSDQMLGRGSGHGRMGAVARTRTVRAKL